MKKMTILWLDDHREPNNFLKNKTNSDAGLRAQGFYKRNIFNKFDVDFEWVKNLDEFSDYIEKNGLPEFISFDMDLKNGNGIPSGSEYPNGEDCAKWLKDYCEKNGQELPPYFVHSANKNAQKNIPEILGVSAVVESRVLTFEEFINENYTSDMDEKIQSYIDEIVDGLTEDALDALGYNGNQYIIEPEELKKLFNKKFMHKEDCPQGEDLCLVYDENNGEMELFSVYEKVIKWSVKCDINSVRSIISCAIECINHCVPEYI